MWYSGVARRHMRRRRGLWLARARSLTEFQTTFPDETSCAVFLFERRWPEGFVCPACSGGRAALLKSRAYTYECLDCGRQGVATVRHQPRRRKTATSTEQDVPSLSQNANTGLAAGHPWILMNLGQRDKLPAQPCYR